MKNLRLSEMKNLFDEVVSDLQKHRLHLLIELLVGIDFLDEFLKTLLIQNFVRVGVLLTSRSGRDPLLTRSADGGVSGASDVSAADGAHHRGSVVDGHRRRRRRSGVVVLHRRWRTARNATHFENR
jgi:hypothetical protein